MSAGCGKRSTGTSSGRCCTPCAAPAIACAPRMSVAEPVARRWRRKAACSPPLRSAVPCRGAFRRICDGWCAPTRSGSPALYFLVFAVSVLGVLFFVYWTSADFVERQTEATLDAEITGLAEQYAQRGLSGLVQIVAARSAGDRGDGDALSGHQPRRPAARRQHHRLAARGAGAPGWLSFQVECRSRARSRPIPRAARCS